MGLLRNWKDLGEAAGSFAGDFAGEVSQALASKVCELHRKYPNSWSGGAFARSYLSNVCADIGEEPPRQIPPPFDGGQCDSERYEFFYTPHARNTTTCNQIFGTPASVIVFGAVSSIFVEYTGVTREAQCPGDGQIVHEVKYFILTGNGRVDLMTNVNVSRLGITAPVGDYYSDITDVSISPIGHADECGDRDPEFPPDPPVDPSDYQGTINFNEYNVDGSVNSNVDIDFNIEATTNLDFPINIDLGGDDFIVDFDGVSSPNSELEALKDNLPSSPPERQPVTSPNPPSGGAYTPVVIEEVEQIEEEVEPGNLAWLLIEITEFPQGDKRLLFAETEDNTYFAGYLSFYIEANGNINRMPEIPIRKQYNSVPVPNNINGYRIYAVNFAKLKVTKYVLPEN